VIGKLLITDHRSPITDNNLPLKRPITVSTGVPYWPLAALVDATPGRVRPDPWHALGCLRACTIRPLSAAPAYCSRSSSLLLFG